MPVIGIICFLVITILIILSGVVYSKKRRSKNQSINNVFTGTNTIQAGAELYLTRLMTTDPWWTSINNSAQLYLAIELAEKTLQIWEQYALRSTLKFTENVNESSRIIQRELLGDSLVHIKCHAIQLNKRSNKEYTKLKRYYDQFIIPVTALTDGYWKLPYAVKKVFYSVYQILKGIIDSDNPITNIDFSNSINNSLEVIDITNLLTEKQIRDILEPYRDKLVIQKLLLETGKKCNISKP